MTTTESASARYASIEDWSSAELVAGILEGQFAAIGAVQGASEAIARTIDAATERLSAGGRLIYLGAGTSGRIATQDAAELPPTYNWPYERALTLMAGGETALNKAAEGAEDSEEEAVRRLEVAGVGANDVVIGLAASGRTPFVIAGLTFARERGALAIGIYNNRGGKVGEACDIAVLLDTGPELVAGSTRMKAGTAQKAALNCISTGVMIRLGFVYRGLMVEMRPTNVKLNERAAQMVADLTGADIETARATLAEADGVIKLATVMLTRSLDRNEAQAALDGAGGNLRRALTSGRQ
ncbi:N-acetylmuramic acid 6-phosphate etherase [Devosia nitrariae]|uniref:N-acetylmuramic acid 6-phosphate etherase n=1 Tax=Devosia nitrariae TaxID=2071872 RepID=A0ABQ5W4G6_9HYPH|nr:N-acetylmuramic acid 6-phosphate etherase [Devosia nitrariae]GLQ54689.1 N-acetylmuramic acid 6-phosphate etherase [Devosia nitrariae]